MAAFFRYAGKNRDILENYDRMNYSIFPVGSALFYLILMNNSFLSAIIH